ncbi:MAG: hypothetical protein IPM48_14430 [Saprospiraceae bacterium]|nr:hypothetical protein [Saprospiraceae bacterium]
MKKTMKGFKAFDKDFKCNGFQYKEGETYEHKGKVELCKSGFHFCENPLDVLNYYNLTDCNFAEVEAKDISEEKSDDSKRVCNKITIKSKLDLKSFVNASVNFLLDICKTKNKEDDSNIDNRYSAKLASSGDYAKLASSGVYAQLASSGYSAKLASSGDSAKLASSGVYAQLASSGDYAQLASSGDSAKLASSGYSAKLASSGDYAKLASSGVYAQLASSGDSAKLASSGDYAQLESGGKDSVVVGIGYRNIAKGKVGSWIVLAEWENDKPICVRAEKIDGKKIKEDVFYELRGGKFVECK